MNLSQSFGNLKQKIVESDGFLTAKGQIYDRAELFHCFLPGLMVGTTGRIDFLMTEMTVIEGYKKKNGHFADLEKDFMYHVAGFTITAEVIPWLISML